MHLFLDFYLIFPITNNIYIPILKKKRIIFIYIVIIGKAYTDKKEHLCETLRNVICLRQTNRHTHTRNEMEREARRKKIASRGTDRMALITGRIQALDPNLSKSSSFSNPIPDHLPAQHARSTSEPVVEKDYNRHGNSIPFLHIFSVFKNFDLLIRVDFLCFCINICYV